MLDDEEKKDNTNLSEEEMAKMWENQDDSNQVETKEANPLDQGDIDALFNVPPPPPPAPPQSLASILASGIIYTERLPILDVVFDRLMRILSTSLRNLTADNVDVHCLKVKSMRFGDFVNSIPLPTMLGIFKAVEWDNNGIVVINSDLVYTMTDTLLGGRKSSRDNTNLNNRSHTTIERSLIERLVKIILADLGAAFAPVTNVVFEFERLEVNPRFALITREKNGVLVFTIRIEMEEKFGQFDMVIPYATIEPIRNLLVQSFMGEKFGQDSMWEGHLADRLWDADIELQAALPSQDFILKDVLEWKKGTQIILSCNMQSPIHVSSSNHELMIGRLGQKNGYMAVKVNNLLFGKGL